MQIKNWKRTRQWTGVIILALLCAGYLVQLRSTDALDAGITPLNAPAADLVRFTATRSYTRLPLDEQIKYLHAWGSMPEQTRAKTLLDLSKEPYVLDLSSANSKQTMALHISRQYFAASPADRKAILDQVIDQEAEMIKSVKATMKTAADQGGKFDTKMGDQKLRKLMIENTPAEVRSELAAFSQAKIDRLRERGIKFEG